VHQHKTKAPPAKGGAFVLASKRLCLQVLVQTGGLFFFQHRKKSAEVGSRVLTILKRSVQNG
jgi:hypothetical protein